MKKLLTAIAAILLLPNSLFAQEPPKSIPLPIMIQCGPTDFTIKLLKDKYKEHPIALGEGQVITPDGDPVRGQMLFWHGEENKTFSVTISFGKNDFMSCLIMNGNNVNMFYNPNADEDPT